MRVIIIDARSLQRALWLWRGTQVALALPNLSPDRRTELESRFDRHLSDSGGRFSALFFAACLASCLLFDMDRRDLLAVHPVSLVTVNLVLCACAALSGKLFGLLRARWQLARLIWAVAELIEDLPAPVCRPPVARSDRYAATRRVSA